MRNLSWLFFLVTLFYGCTAPNDRQCNCPPVEDPVCGEDGISYTSACNADCAGIGVRHVGPCGADAGQPVCACAAVSDPVCGTDGKTYGSACLAGCAGVAIASVGACPDPSSCRTDADCAPRSDCCGVCGTKSGPPPAGAYCGPGCPGAGALPAACLCVSGQCRDVPYDHNGYLPEGAACSPGSSQCQPGLLCCSVGGCGVAGPCGNPVQVVCTKPYFTPGPNSGPMCPPPPA
jgi:hypothetical protein